MMRNFDTAPVRSRRFELQELLDHLRDPAVDSKQFRRDLKTYLFAGHSKR